MPNRRPSSHSSPWSDAIVSAKSKMDSTRLSALCFNTVPSCKWSVDQRRSIVTTDMARGPATRRQQLNLSESASSVRFKTVLSYLHTWKRLLCSCTQTKRACNVRALLVFWGVARLRARTRAKPCLCTFQIAATLRTSISSITFVTGPATTSPNGAADTASIPIRATRPLALRKPRSLVPIQIFADIVSHVVRQDGIQRTAQECM